MLSIDSELFSGNKMDMEQLTPDQTSFDINNLQLRYGSKLALDGISMKIPKHQITAFIGPSGCGKSTLLRCLNRMNDLIDDCHMSGQIRFDGRDIYQRKVDVAALRRNIGMVFQRPNPFPKSIYENLVYGLRLQGVNDRRILDEAVEKGLKAAALWDEVKDRLSDNALSLSGGQQQRLVIARALAIEPKVLLLDEPTSALDPLSTLVIEELITGLKREYTVVIVTHNMQQAARVSDNTAYMYEGKLIEYRDTNTLFTTPSEKSTEDYITGRMG